MSNTTRAKKIAALQEQAKVLRAATDATVAEVEQVIQGVGVIKAAIVYVKDRHWTVLVSTQAAAERLEEHWKAFAPKAGPMTTCAAWCVSVDRRFEEEVQ